jgi:hypothetical protein
LAWYLAKADLDWGDSPLFQARPLVIMGVTVGLTAVFARQILGMGLDHRWLIGLLLFRAIGMLFVLEWARGNLPRSLLSLRAGAIWPRQWPHSLCWSDTEVERFPPERYVPSQRWALPTLSRPFSLGFSAATRRFSFFPLTFQTG